MDGERDIGLDDQHTRKFEAVVLRRARASAVRRRRRSNIADVSRFCHGTATVECAGVGEAREDTDEIVEVPPNTGMVQSHVVALVPRAPICK